MNLERSLLRYTPILHPCRVLREAYSYKAYNHENLNSLIVFLSVQWMFSLGLGQKLNKNAFLQVFRPLNPPGRWSRRTNNFVQDPPFSYLQECVSLLSSLYDTR